MYLRLRRLERHTNTPAKQRKAITATTATPAVAPELSPLLLLGGTLVFLVVSTADAAAGGERAAAGELVRADGGGG